MSGHLEPVQLDAYLRRTLDAPALLAADDHLARCVECRERGGRAITPIRQLRRSLVVAHLTQEQFELYADRRLTDAEAVAHLKECPDCLAEAQDLSQFVRAGAFFTPAAPKSRWRFAVAAAVCATLVGAGVLIVRSAREPANVAKAPAASVIPDDLREIRDEALRLGRIVIPPEIAALRGKIETQQEGSAAPQPELEYPVGMGVLFARPEFRWRAFPGAQRYEVSVFTIAGRPVTSSGPLQATSWTPQEDLPAGEVYVWELSVTVNGKLITAPRPPAPQARFLVVANTDRTRLAEIAARFPHEHVLLGVMYAKMGALAEARRELQAAVNAGQVDAAPLLKSLE